MSSSSILLKFRIENRWLFKKEKRTTTLWIFNLQLNRPGKVVWYELEKTKNTTYTESLIYSTNLHEKILNLQCNKWKTKIKSLILHALLSTEQCLWRWWQRQKRTIVKFFSNSIPPTALIFEMIECVVLTSLSLSIILINHNYHYSSQSF